MAERLFCSLSERRDGSPLVRRPITVKEAWDRYIAKLKIAGKAVAAADITRRYNCWIKPEVKLAATPILKLTAGQVNDWRVKLAETPAIPQNKKLVSTKPRSASALNRDMAVFKTVLNLALEDGYATSDAPWRTKLKPVNNATKRRDCYLDLSQRRALIDKAQKRSRSPTPRNVADPTAARSGGCADSRPS